MDTQATLQYLQHFHSMTTDTTLHVCTEPKEFSSSRVDKVDLHWFALQLGKMHVVLLHKQFMENCRNSTTYISAVIVRIGFIKHAFSSSTFQFLLTKKHLFAANALYQLISSGNTKNSLTLVHLTTF